jgi:release factor glutamine methyltransferase
MKIKNIEIKTSEDVYEPSEDTFLLLEALYQYNLKNKKVLEIGTGSGIVAIYCSKKGAHVVATDISSKALKLAEENAKLNSAKIKFLRSNLFDKIEGKFDLIIFNAPYIPGKESPMWSGGKQGVEIANRFLKNAVAHLEENGFILLVMSSVAKIDKIIIPKGFLLRILKERKIAWENLYLFKIFRG